MTNTLGKSAAPPFVCPKCGYGNINELSLCVVMHRVTEWDPLRAPHRVRRTRSRLGIRHAVLLAGWAAGSGAETHLRMLPLWGTIPKSKARRHRSTNMRLSPGLTSHLLGNSHALAAVDNQQRAGNVARRVRRKEDARIGDFLDAAEALKRARSRHHLLDLWIRPYARRRAFGVNRAGARCS